MKRREELAMLFAKYNCWDHWREEYATLTPRCLLNLLQASKHRKALYGVIATLEQRERVSPTKGQVAAIVAGELSVGLVAGNRNLEQVVRGELDKVVTE